MATGKQSRAARALLGLSQVDLARLSGVSPARVTAFENNANCLKSTCDRIEAALKLKGARFSEDGGVRIAPKPEAMVRGPGNPTREQRRIALAIVNSARELRGQAPLVDEEDE